MIGQTPPKQSAAPTALRQQTQYHGTPTALRSFYNNQNTRRQLFLRKPHPLSYCMTWTAPNMERKTLNKPTGPTSTASTPGKNAPKHKNLPSQKSSTKPSVNSTPSKTEKAGKEQVLHKPTSQVIQLFDRTLPAVPHVLSSLRPRNSPPDERPHSLFTREEYNALQYMTLMDCAERETLQIMPSWQLEESGVSPSSAGGKSTPNGEGDTKKTEFRKKIKFGDYAKVGRIVTTKSGTVTAMVHELPPKPSLKKDARGAMVSTKISKPAVADDEGSTGQDVAPSMRGGGATAAPDGIQVKGKSAPSELQSKSNLAAVKLSEKHSKAGDLTYPEGLKPTKTSSQLPAATNPNPQTPVSNPQPKAIPNGADRTAQIPTNSNSPKSNLKRLLPDDEISSPAKKVKVSPNGPSAKRPLAEDESSSPATKKAKLSNGVDVKDPKPSPQASKPVSRSSPANTKNQPTLKSKQAVSLEINSKSPAAKSGASESIKPVPATTTKSTVNKLPPLLSPTLPPQVSAANGSSVSPLGMLAKSRASKASLNPTAAKSPKPKSDGSAMAEKESAQSKFHIGIPPLLSPDLPPAVEAAIAERDARLAAAKDASSSEKQVDTPKRTIDTVADRHEKSRQPNAPGIARKVVKNGKNRQEDESTPARATGTASQTVETSKEQIPSLVVKLKYKKKQRKDIERILKLRADPASYDHMSNETISKTAAGSSRNQVGDRLPNKDERRNSQDRPRASERSNAASKRPAPSSTAQKRPRPEEPQQLNSKRLNPSDPSHSSKPATPSTPAFKSSAVSAPPSAHKVITPAPKKGDAPRGTAMASVNSTDGSVDARTPQLSQASVPGSAGKPVNPARNGNLTQRESANAIAVKLKREMDRLHQIKQEGPDSVSSADRKLGILVGLECSLAYMTSFELMDNSMAAKRLPNNGKNWDDLLKLHNYIDRTVRDIPILDVLSLQIKILSRYKMTGAFASTGFDGVDLSVASQNVLGQEQLWKELDHKMSDGLVQAIEESTSGTKKGFNPGGNFKQFIATSLKKLQRYADTEGVNWQQKLDPDY